MNHAIVEVEKKYKKCCLNKENSNNNSIENHDIELYNNLYNMYLGLRQNALENKDHIKKYKEIRSIHSEIMSDIVKYFESGKYDIEKYFNDYLDSYPCNFAIN